MSCRVLEDRRVLLSGGASGIGRATAFAMVDAGANVIAMDIKDMAGAIPGVQCVAGDVSRPEDWARAVELATSRLGGLDVLVNCAGIHRMSSIEETSLEEWNRVLAVNLTGAFLGLRAALPELRRRHGCVVNVASALGLVGGDRVAAYSASKGGLVLFTKSAAVELGPFGIRVNCVCPGPIETPLLDNAARLLQSDVRGFANLTATGKLGQPEEVAAAIVFLASAAASFLTGVALPVDGGRTAR